MGRLPLSSFEFKFATIYFRPQTLSMFNSPADKRSRSLVVGGKWGSNIDASWAFAPLWRNFTDSDTSSFSSRRSHVVTIGWLISFIEVNSCLCGHIITNMRFVRLSSKGEVLDFEFLNTRALSVMRVVSINYNFTFLCRRRFLVTFRRLVAMLVPVAIATQSVWLLFQSLISRVLLITLSSSTLSLHHRKTIMVTLFFCSKFRGRLQWM